MPAILSKPVVLPSVVPSNNMKGYWLDHTTPSKQVASKKAFSGDPLMDDVEEQFPSAISAAPACPHRKKWAP